MQREDTPTTAVDSRNRFDYPLPPRLLGIAGVQPLALEVAEADDIGPRMRRIRLRGTGLEDFSYQAGQDVMLVLGGTLERPLSRRYTIRDFDRLSKTLELNIVSHGVHGPGAEWSDGTRPGDRVNGVGPRGKIFLNPSADWHLFLGDESAAPAWLAMLEALPVDAQASAYLDIALAEDELPSSTRHQVRWLARGGDDKPAWSSTLLVEAMRSFDLPPGRGQVYIAGEVQVVAAVQRAALARGLAPEQLSPKAYWGRAKANANNGEPEKSLDT
jgi:NADPH-dependent ferric siderophore reductase